MTSLPDQAVRFPFAGQACAMLATDIAGFSSPRRDDETRMHIRQALYAEVSGALTGSGIPWPACHHEDRGDGMLVIIPPGIPAGALTGPFPALLRAGIRRHNHMSCEPAGIQLRAAVHVGPVYSDAHGVAGADITHLFRMLNARPLRKALEGTSAELALAVSEYIHTMILRNPSLAGPAHYTPFRSKVKNATVNGWLCLPGTAP